ncbi:MAG: DNA methyltransferase [Planctomycetia bacterium]|nr:DNA methyltransferase [Planctomycetia bacterium]
MKLDYENKLDEEYFLGIPAASAVRGQFIPDKKMLFQGDNIDVLKFLLQNGYESKIDLIYIDPPFATKNVFTIGNERVSTISSSKKDKTAYSDSLTGSDFIEFLRLRLILLHKLLSEKGSLYLHIDYKIGHYVKIIMDEIFGNNNFRNDITRIKCNPKNFSRKAYGNIKDLILFYSKSSTLIWHDPKEPLAESDVSTRFSKTDAKGRRYTTVLVHAPGETKKWPHGRNVERNAAPYRKTLAFQSRRT